MYRAYYPVDNPSDYWKISLCLVFLDNLVDKISKRVVSNKGSFLACYLNPASLLNLTPEIVDRLSNALYQTDLQREVDFVGVLERWKIREALVDDKPERLLDTIHAANRDLYNTRLYTASSVSY